MSRLRKIELEFVDAEHNFEEEFGVEEGVSAVGPSPDRPITAPM